MSKVTINSSTADYSKYPNTNFDFDLPLIVKNCVSISMNSIIIPFSYNVIHDFNNKLYVDTNEGNGHTLVAEIKQGVYTNVDTFKDEVQQAINDALSASLPSSTDQFTVTYEAHPNYGGDHVNRIKIANGGVHQFKVLWSRSFRIAQMLGFRNKDDEYSNAVQAEYDINLTGADAIRVEFLPFALNTQSNDGNTNYFQIPVNVNPGGTIIWISQYDSDVFFNSLQNVHHIQVRLVEADTLQPLGGSLGINNPVFMSINFKART